MQLLQKLLHLLLLPLWFAHRQRLILCTFEPSKRFAPKISIDMPRREQSCDSISLPTQTQRSINRSISRSTGCCRGPIERLPRIAPSTAGRRALSRCVAACSLTLGSLLFLSACESTHHNPRLLGSQRPLNPRSVGLAARCDSMRLLLALIIVLAAAGQ